MDIGKLLRPKSMALVGASERPGTMGNSVTELMLRSSIKDHVYLINPTKDTVHGVKAYKSLSSLPEVPDCVAILVSYKHVLSVLEEAGRLGIGGAVVFASGFSEVGSEEGKQREAELIRICREYGIALLGPNCGGFINDRDDISPYAIGGGVERRDGLGLSIISQSGGVTVDMYDNPYTRVSYALSVGNGSVLGLEDYLEYLLDDDATQIISLYVEGIKQPRKFTEMLAKAAQKRKPVLILKGGRSVRGAASTASHTGSLAGSYGVFEAVAKRYGAILVDSLGEMRSTAIALGAFDGKYPNSFRLASGSLSGAAATLCADLAEENGVEFPDFSEDTVKKLYAVLPDFATVHNPLDATNSFSSADSYASVLKAFSEDPGIDGILLTVAEFIRPDALTVNTFAAVRKLRESGVSTPIVMVPSLEDSRLPEYCKELHDLNAFIISPGKAGYTMLRKLNEFFSYKADTHTLDISSFDRIQTNMKGHFLTEYESKMALAETHIPSPSQVLIKKESDIVEASKHLNYPMIMKISSRDIPHKTEAGGVKLNLHSLPELQEAYQTILSNAKAYAPDAVIDGVLLSEMAPMGTEMILGVKTDPIFGPVLLVGMGGIYVDIFKDIALQPCPVSKTEALEMLHSLKAYQLLAGYRGSKPCDIDSLTTAMVDLSIFAANHKDSISELDINPLFVYPEGDGVTMVDALIMARDDSAHNT